MLELDALIYCDNDDDSKTQNYPMLQHHKFMPLSKKGIGSLTVVT